MGSFLLQTNSWFLDFGCREWGRMGNGVKGASKRLSTLEAVQAYNGEGMCSYAFRLQL